MKRQTPSLKIASVMLASLLIVAGCEPSTVAVPQPASFGRFEGDIIAQWDNDGRNMTLREPFRYIDGQDRIWHAPAGSVVNGASIPYAFWSVIGGPFEGQYRNASVVHDIGCHEMTASWEDVHRMFYEACRCGGVDETKAKMMYYAVYHFGPRWEVVNEAQVQTVTAPNGQTVRQEVPVQTVVRVDPPPPTQAEIAQVEAMIVEENPTPKAIEQTNREVLRQRPRGSYRSKSGPGSNGPGGEPWSRPDRDGLPKAGSITANSSATNAAEPQTRAREWNQRSMTANRPGGGNAPPGFQPRGNQAQRGMAAPANQPLSPEESQWAQTVVHQHLERQTGEARPVDCTVERTERGYRVQVQYVELNDQGQPIGYNGSSQMRVSRDGRVMEVINR